MLHNKYNQKYNHRDIKRELDIPPHIYFDILNRNSGEFIGGHGFDCYYFKIKENAQIAIDEIESYLIIEKLMRE